MYEDSYAGDPLDKARNFFEEGLYGHATQLLEEYLQEEPESYEGRLFLADCFYESRDLDKAADHYLQCLRQEPSDVEPWLRLGLIYSQQGKPQKALEHFAEAARIDPSCDRAYAYRIPCYQALGMREDAIQAFDQAEVLNNENADAHFFIGAFYYEQSDIDFAIKHLERALWLDVTYPNARNMLANCFRSKKDSEKAKEYFEEQLYYEEDDEESLIGLAQILLEEGDLARTEPLIEHAGELDPDNPQVDQLRAFLA
ncbi:MAG: tetratricopeptide repeat protein, partial [bacterium]